MKKLPNARPQFELSPDASYTEGAPSAGPRANGPDRGRRSLLVAGSAALASSALGLHAPAVIGQAKRFSGVTLNVSCWSANYPSLLADYVREFTEQTGAKVNYDTPGLQVYNQRADLELSTKGAGFDVLNITFIFTSRWIGNGWFTPLDPFINDRNKTSAEFDFADFLPGALSPLKDAKGATYGIPWVTDSGMAIAARYDLLQANGLGMPDTFDELETVAGVLHKKDGVDGFLTDNHWGFWYIPLLQGYGGNVFRAPPDDLMPTLDTPEAIHAADQLARIVSKYGPPGAGGMAYGQTAEILKAARANCRSSHTRRACRSRRRATRRPQPFASPSCRAVPRVASPASRRMAGAFPWARRTRTRPGPSSSGRCPRNCCCAWSGRRAWGRSRGRRSTARRNTAS